LSACVSFEQLSCFVFLYLIILSRKNPSLNIGKTKNIIDQIFLIFIQNEKNFTIYYFIYLPRFYYPLFVSPSLCRLFF